LFLALKVGQHRIEMAELPSHHLQASRQLNALRLKRCSAKDTFIDGD